MYKNEDFSTLKAGDEVLVIGRNHTTIKTVDRITKTQIIIGNDKFRLSNGFEITSDSWNRDYLQTITPERVAQFHKDKARARLERETYTLINRLVLDGNHIKHLSDAHLVLLRDVLWRIDQEQ